MKKIMYSLLLLLIVSGAPLWAGYSYTVSGKVLHQLTGLPVKGAVVTHSIYWPAGTSSGSKISAADGSFSFALTSDSWDFKGVNMNLKASTFACSGGTTWTCQSYAETVDVYVSCMIEINPDLHVALVPGLTPSPGAGLSLTAVGFMDNPPPPKPVVVQQFQIILRFDPGKLIFAGLQSTPGSRFVIEPAFSDPAAGEIVVLGHAPEPVELPVGQWGPDSFFDVFFELPEGMEPSFTALMISEESELLNPVGIPPHIQHPYPHQTLLLLGEPEPCQTAFLIDSLDDWMAALEGGRPGPNIRPTPMTAWEAYMAGWKNPDNQVEGEPYPETTFIPACKLEEEPGGMLYVWPEIHGQEDPGLVMAWGDFGPDSQLPEGNYASAWRWDYGLDPDLSNSTIQVTVTPPMGVNITAVSFAIVDVNGLVRSWWWAVPAAIPSGVATTVTINTALAGPGATMPPATGYLNTAGFDITQAQFFDVDENFQYIFGQQPVPPPGQTQFMAWNYWHNLIVTKNTKAYKGTYVKWSQPPVVLDEASDMPHIQGWDERSLYHPQYRPIVADDWQCTDERPITDIHWWGSFIGWTQPYLPPVLPRAFHLGIWTNVPAVAGDPLSFSHPGQMIWEHVCDKWVWNFAGYDIDPRCEYPELPCEKNEACFQFNQLLSENEWFYQKPDPDGQGGIYWLSIAAIYDADVQEIRYPWGWKTRPHFFEDDAVRIQVISDPTGLNVWPPKLGAIWSQGEPIALPPYPNPNAVSWDLAFELTTNKPTYADNPIPGDIGREGGVLIPDGKVNLHDLLIMASNWLAGTP